MRQRDTEPVHAFGAVGREARVVLADAPRVAHHLREPEVPPPVVLLVLAQDRRHVGARRVPPDSVGRDDGVGRPLVDGIGQRQRHAAFGGLDGVVPADVVRALVGFPEPEAPLRLDRGSRRRVVDHVGNALALALGDLGERVLERLRRFPHRRPGRTTCRTGRRSPRWAAAALPCAGASAHRPTKLSRCPPRRCCRRSRPGSWHTSDYFGLTVAHRACVFQTVVRSAWCATCWQSFRSRGYQPRRRHARIGVLPCANGAPLDRQQSDDAEQRGCHQIEAGRQRISGLRDQPSRD